MTHWAEGQARTDLRDDLGNREAKGVRAFVAVRMNEQVEDVGREDDRRAEASARRRPMGAARQPAYHAQVSRRGSGFASIAAAHRRTPSARDQDGARSRSPRRASARSPTSSIRARFGSDCTACESGALAALAARLETVAAEYGFEREKRRWSGHLTIGRVRDESITDKTRDASERGAGPRVRRLENRIDHALSQPSRPRRRQLRSARNLSVPVALAVRARFVA